ncbi:MAG: porin [Pseudomonadota bacterium]
MKKNVIALAVAAAMVAPLAAQAEVKVSGQLQTEITSLSGDNVTDGLYMNDAQEGGTPDKGNFGALNFTASEDLGNGMKAIAKVGMNVWAADHNAKGIKTRDAYIGLSGGFGTVMMGTMSSPYKMATVKWDPFLATSAQARGNYGMSELHNGYVNNAIAYANKFGMAKVVAAIVLDENADAFADPANSETTGNHAISFSVNAPVGPVELAFGYHDASDYGVDSADPLNPVLSPSAQNDDFTAMKLGVKYAAGPISVAFQHETLEVGKGVVDTTIEGDTTDITHMYLNATYTAGANTFAFAYGLMDEDENIKAVAPGTADPTPTYMSLGMVHGFSKKTSVHVAYVAMDTDVSCTALVTTGCGDDAGIAAGLRVKF